VNLVVKQSFTTSSQTADGTFSYRLTPSASDHPMPETRMRSTNLSEDRTFAISGNSDVTIGPIVYDHAGVYHYDLTPIIDAPREGYTYDQRTYHIDVFVTDDSQHLAQVVAHDGGPSGAKVAELRFDNRFNLPFTPDPTPGGTGQPGPGAAPGGTAPGTPPSGARAPTGGRVL
jgi:pilin isopeptide linkage protein